MTDREAIRALLASAPVGALLVVLFGWALASFVGGLLAAWIGSNAPTAHALVLGGLLTLPPPGWFWIPTLLVFLLAAYVGARLAPTRSPARG